MTIRAALRQARAALVHSDSPDLDAQLLLAQALVVERATLFAHPERALTPRQSRCFQALLARRAVGEPVAYILGRRGFYDIDLRVTPATLIPRPETELLLEEALRLSESLTEATVADIGTGSGALAIAFQRRRPAAKSMPRTLAPRRWRSPATMPSAMPQRSSSCRGIWRSR